MQEEINAIYRAKKQKKIEEKGRAQEEREKKRQRAKDMLDTATAKRVAKACFSKARFEYEHAKLAYNTIHITCKQSYDKVPSYIRMTICKATCHLHSYCGC